MFNLPEIQYVYYQALFEKDKMMSGKFYAAVKTTDIFCLSTCYARNRKYENIDFYKTISEVKVAGFRACKLCSAST